MGERIVAVLDCKTFVNKKIEHSTDDEETMYLEQKYVKIRIIQVISVKPLQNNQITQIYISNTARVRY